MSVSMMILAAAAAAQSPAGAAATQTSVSYTARQADGGKLLLVGADGASGKAIRLKLFPNGFVSGRIGDKPVRYWISRQERERLARKAAAEAAAS